MCLLLVNLNNLFKIIRAWVSHKPPWAVRAHTHTGKLALSETFSFAPNMRSDDGQISSNVNFGVHAHNQVLYRFRLCRTNGSLYWRQSCNCGSAKPESALCWLSLLALTLSAHSQRSLSALTVLAVTVGAHCQRPLSAPTVSAHCVGPHCQRSLLALTVLALTVSAHCQRSLPALTVLAATASAPC